MILAIIQARMGSTRLPGKSMALLEGVPVIEHVIKRVQAAQYVQKICLATTSFPADDVLAEKAEELGIDVYRGCVADDVLGRFFWCAERYPEAECIVRITADDVFKDPALIDRCIEAFLMEWQRWGELGKEQQEKDQTGPPEYMHLGGKTWALGADVEIFTRRALTESYQLASTPFDREHVTPFMEREYGKWVLKDDESRRTWLTKWSVDDEDDLEFARAVYAQLYNSNPLFGYADMCEAGF